MGSTTIDTGLGESLEVEKQRVHVKEPMASGMYVFPWLQFTDLGDLIAQLEEMGFRSVELESVNEYDSKTRHKTVRVENLTARDVRWAQKQFFYDDRYLKLYRRCI